MYSLVIKIIMALWPFLKRAIFGDRTTKEVILEHKNMTFVFGMLVIIVMSFSLALGELRELKNENTKLKNAITPPEVELPIFDDSNLKRRRQLMDEAL